MSLKCLLLLCALAGTQAGPLSFYENSDTQCATTCPDTQKFAFAPGTTYEYRYESDVTTSIPGATEESSALHVTATARVETLSNCEMALVLDDVLLTDSDPMNPRRRQPVQRSDEFKRSLERRPLRFGYVNGRVENVCPSSEEETWVVNVKRAIVSALQNSQHDLNTDTETREIDVSGTCDVTYKVEGGRWGTKTIRKTKDLLSCTGRHSASTILQAVHYDVPSKLQSVPIVRSTHECEQQVNRAGVIAQASCKEKHVFRPFSRDNSGATTEVEFTLAFQKEIKRTTTRVESIDGRKSLRFDHTPSREDVQQNYRAAEQTLRALCEQTTRDVRPDTPSHFNTLVQQMRVLDAPSLQRLHQMSSSGSICQSAEKFFHDALPTISTEASVSLMAQLIRQREPESEETALWLNSLAFIPSATKVMLAEVKPILEMTGFERKAALSISALVNTYCRENPSCGLESEVREIVSIYERNLAYNCQSEQHDKVLMSLKALGNTGHAEQVVPTLNRCFLNEQIPMEIRVAAVNAFRRMACTADRAELESVFRNRDADSELRINAYLSLMQCPTQFLINTIRSTLESEEVNQVGSFVWTHLTNLKETSSPFKQQARLILEDTRLQKEFDLDKRKFSRNIEKSVFSEMLNSGASIDSNLIWSTKSFVPRSASANLTVDIFGQAINLVEVGGRVEGLDGVLERFFSPQPEDENSVNQPGINKLDNKFQQERDETPQGSYFVRIFGNEIKYEDFHGFDVDSVRERFNYLQWLIELAKNHEFDYTKSTKFIDTTISLPTAVGLPLKLSLDGTAVMDIKVNGKLDIRNMAAAPRSMDIDGSVKPSASILISSEMGVDAWVAKTGLKMTNTFHTSTVLDGKIQLQDGKIFKFDLNMPKERMEIFDFQSKFFISHRNADREQRMIVADRTELNKCTGNYFERVTGLELCSTLSYPDLYPQQGAPWFPLNGPVSASVILTKKDSYDKISFEAALMSEKDRSSGRLAVTHIARISFNTPGSQVDRELLFDFALNEAEKNVNLNMKSPWSQSQFTGSIRNERDIKRISTSLVINKREEYGAVAQLQMDDTTVVPTLELTTPGRAPVRLGGSVINKNGRRLVIDLTLENAAREPIALKGTLVNKKFEKMTADLELTSPWMNGDLNSYVDTGKGSMDGSVKLSYQMNGGRKYRFTVDQSYRHARSGATSEINYSGSYSSTRWPGYNADMTLKATKDSNSQSLSMDGGLTRDKSKRLTINQEGTLRMGYNKVANFDGTLKLPFMGWDLGAKTENSLKRDELRSATKVQYDTEKEANFDVALTKKTTSPIKMSAEAKLRFPGREMSYTHTLEETAPKNYDHKLRLELDPYTVVEVDSTFKSHPKFEVKGTVKVPSVEQVAFEGHLKPELDDFQSRAFVRLGGTPYATEINWQHRPNRQGFSSAADVQLQYETKKIEADAQIGKRGTTLNGKVEAKWDALRDKSKSVSVIGEVETTSAPTVQLKATWWPRNFVEVNGNFKNQKTGYWSSYGDVEGHVDVKSSFRGYEQMSANVQLESQGQEHKYHYDGAWNNDKINFDSSLKLIKGWSNFQFSADLETPFEEVRKGHAEYTHNHQAGQLSCNSKVQWNNQEMSLDLNGRANLARHILSGSATFKSPFRYARTLSLSGRHSDDGNNFQSEVQGQWNNKKAAVGFTMSHQNNGWFIDNSGELTVTTPVNGYRVNKLTWNHHNDRDEFKPHVELELGDDKSVFDIDATTRSNYKKFRLQVKSILNTPYFNNLRFELDHQHNPRDGSFIKTDVTGQWAPNKVMHFEYDVKRTSPLAWTENIKLTSPFFEPYTSDVTANFDGPIMFKQEVKWGRNQKMVFDLNANYKNAEFDGTATFMCPWIDDIIVTANNKMEARTWVSSGSLQYSPGKKIEANTRFSNTELKRISVDFASPCPYLRKVFFDLEHRGSLKQFETQLNFNHDMLREPVTADMKLDITRRSSMLAQMNVKTPFEQLPFFSIDANHQNQRDTKMTTSITVNHPECQIVVNDEMTLNSLKNFNSVSSLELCRKTFELSTQFNAERNIAGTATLKTPYTEDMTVTFNHEGELNDFKSSGELSYSGSKTVTGNVEFKKSGTRIQGDARLNMPVRGYETLAVSFNTRGGWRNFQNNYAVEVGRNKVTGNNEFSLRGDNLNLKTTTQTPFDGYESMSLELSHNGDLENFKSELSMTCSRQKISASAEFNSQRDVTGKFELRTPFRSARNFIVNFNHAGRSTNFQNSGSIQINRDVYSGTSAFSLNGNKMEVRASVKVPEEYSLTINHDGPKDNFNNRITIDLAGQRIDGENKFSLDGYNVAASGTLKTPFRALDTLTANYNYAGYPSNFQTTAMLGVNRHRGNLKANFNKRDDNLSGKLELTTTFQSLGSFVAMFDHSGSLSQFENSGSVDINGQSYTGSSRFSIQRSQIQGSAVLRIPEEYKIEFSHKGGLRNWKNSVEFSLKGDKVTGHSAFKNNRNGVTASAGVNTPFRALRVVDVSLSHSGDLDAFENSATLRVNDNRYSGSSNFQKSEAGLTGSITLNLPEEYGVNFNHNGDLIEFTNSGAVKVAGVAYTGRSQFSRRGQIRGSTVLNLPDEYGVEFNHEGDLSNFKSEGVLNFGSRRYTGRSQFSKRGDKVSGGVSVHVPEEYGVEFKHEGDLNDFNNEGVLTFGREKYTGKSRFSKRGNNVNGGVSVHIPEEYGVQFKHEGDLDNFNNEGVLTFGREKYTGTSRFSKRGNRVEGSAFLNIPERYGVEYKHRGDLNNFNNEGTLTYGRRQITGTSRFSRRGQRVEGAVTVNTPEPYGVEFQHEGDLTNFNNEGTLTYGRKRFNGNSRFTKQGSRVEGSATVNIPEPYGVEFKHEGDLDNFNNEGAVTYRRDRYTGSSRFSKQGKRLSGGATVNIPDEYSFNFNHRGSLDSFSNDGAVTVAGRKYNGETEFTKRGARVSSKAKINIPEEYSVGFGHQGDFNDFQNSGVVKVDRRTYAGKSSFKKSGTRVEGAASVNVPEEYGFKFTHMGGLKEFANSGEVKVDRAVYSGSSEFRLDNSGVEGRASARVPQEYAVSFKHQGPVTRFNNEAAVKIPGREFSGNTEFTLTGNNVAGQATIRLPEEYGLSFSHQGPLKSFNNELTVRTPQRAYTGTSQLKMNDEGIAGAIKANLPREYGVEFNHEGKWNNFNNKATVTYANRKYSGLSELLLKGKKAEGRVVLRVPDMYSIKFKHQGSLRDFSNEAMLKAFNKKFTMGSEFRMNGDTVRGTANVRIPEEYKLTFSHNGPPTDFNTNTEAILDGKTYTANVAFKKEGKKIESSGQITTPHRQAKSLEYRYNHQGDLYNFKQDVYAAAGNQRFSAKSEYSLSGKELNGRVEVATPFHKARTVVLEVKHDGKLKNFKNSATLEINDKRYTANGEMKLFGKKKQGSFMVNIPEEYGFKFMHKGGSVTDWTNKATVSLGEERIDMNSALSIEPTNIDAMLSVRTPFRQARDFGFTFNHKGDASKFTTMAEVTTPVREYKRFAAELNFEGNGRSFQTNGKLQVPTLDDMSFNMNHRSQLNNYGTSAAVEMGQKKIFAETSYRKQGKNLETSLNVETPFRHYEKMGFTYSHNNDKDGFTSNFNIDTPFQQYRSFGANVRHKGNRRDFQSAASFQTPFSMMPLLNINVNHKGDLRDFDSSGSVEYGTQRMEGAATYRRTSPDWAEGSHIGSLRLNTPFRYVENLNLNIEHRCGSNAMSGKLEATYNGRKYFDGDYSLEKTAKKNLAVNVREPHPMSLSASYEKRNGGVEIISDFNWDTRRTDSNGRIAMTCGIENGRRFSNGEFLLANIPSSRMAYEIESTFSSRRNQKIYDGRVKVTSALANWEGTFNHVCAPGSRYMTEIRVGDAQKVMVRSEVLVNRPGVKTILTVGHPSFSNDIEISAEGQIGGEALFEGKASLAYADQRFEGAAKFLDKSQRGDSRYSTEWHVTHPGSFLDVTFKSEVGSSRQAVTGNMEVNYMTTRDKQMKTMSLRSEINKIRDELNMEVITPLNNMRMTGRIMPEERGKQQFILTGNMDNQEVRAELEVNKDKPGADIKLYQNDKMIHVYGKYMDRSMVQFEAYRQVNGARIQEAQLAVRLNNSQLLHARAYLRPDLMQDLQTVLEQDTGFLRAVRRSSQAVSEELSLKATRLRRALRPVIDVVSAVLDKLAQKAEIVTDAVRNMYRRNSFYLRDSTDAVSAWLESFSHVTRRGGEHIMNKARELHQAARQNVGTASERIRNYSRYATGLAYDSMAVSNKYINDAYEMVMSHPRVQTIRDTDYWRMFEAWKARVLERCTLLANEFWSFLDQYPTLKSYVVAYADVVKEKLNELKRSEPVRMLDEITRLSYDTVRDRVVDIIQQYTQAGKARFIVWDPSRGEYQVEIQLPLPVRDLQSMPHARIQSYIDTIKSYLSDMTPQSDWSMWDTYYTYKPTSDITDWVPPFKAHATIAGNQHFMTFDKRFFEFAGECSYLLARDFIDGQFSVIVNYDQVGNRVVKKSISVISDGKNIEIFPNFKVNMDGVQTELPIVAGHTYVSREGNNVKVISDHGMKVTCDLPHDRCTVDVTGWYYGKTGGLFGTYDNEPSNDFTNSERQQESQVEQLADSWTVGRRCRVSNRATHVREVPNTRMTQLCASYYRDQSSPFRKCFKQVDNEAFMHMCLDEMPVDENRLPTEEDICNVASFYVDECRRSGVPLTMPSACLSCELKSGEKFTNRTLRGREVPQSADVVMVVSHRQCNADLLNKIDNIVAQVDSSLRDQGIKKPQFSVVGYGGEGPLSNPHSHTMDGEIFNSKYKFGKAMQSFPIASLPNEDALEALEYAARLPFRTGVSKSIILLPCGACTEQAVNYADVQRLLFQRDIRLHVLTQQHFQLKADKSTSYIFGADREEVFTNKDVGENDISGDRGLRSQLRMPKDLCVALTEESSGSVFNSLKLVEGKSVGQKKFLDVLSRVVAKKADPSDCQVCSCVADKSGLGQSVCKSCSAPSYTRTPVKPEDQFEADLNEYMRKPGKELSKKEQRMLRRAEKRRNKE